MPYFVYKMTCLINGKYYIGQTNNFDRRWRDHVSLAKNKPKLLVEQAMRKYGINSFMYELVEGCLTQEEVNIKEAENILRFNSLAPNGYNVEKGGKYAPQSPEALLKISQALKGRPSHNKGKPCSEERKAKTSATMTGRKYSEERRRNSANARKGIPAWNKGKSSLSEEQIVAVQSDNRLHRIIAAEYNVSMWVIFAIKKRAGIPKVKRTKEATENNSVKLIAIMQEIKSGTVAEIADKMGWFIKRKDLVEPAKARVIRYLNRLIEMNLIRKEETRNYKNDKQFTYYWIEKEVV